MLPFRRVGAIMIESIVKMIENVPQGYKVSGWIYISDPSLEGSAVWYDDVRKCYESVDINDNTVWVMLEYANPDAPLLNCLLATQKSKIAKADLRYMAKS